MAASWQCQKGYSICIRFLFTSFGRFINIFLFNFPLRIAATKTGLSASVHSGNNSAMLTVQLQRAVSLGLGSLIDFIVHFETGSA